MYISLFFWGVPFTLPLVVCITMYVRYYLMRIYMYRMYEPRSYIGYVHRRTGVLYFVNSILACV